LASIKTIFLGTNIDTTTSLINSKKISRDLPLSQEQRTENREQRTENREQRTENREQVTWTIIDDLIIRIYYV
jgi:hypothetical protein